MARKNLLASIASKPVDRATSEGRTEYVRQGASRSLMASIDEMAESAKRLMEGESIVLLAPEIIDESFVADRLKGRDEDLSALKDAIRASGQSTPILVRPHPDAANRYMVVFGHRRLRVARELGIKVRAVVKDMEEIAHVIAQGQENAARTNLSFIEKAVFAAKLLRMGHEKNVAKAALAIDDTLLSRMLAVAEVIPEAVIDAVGPANGVGRDRWEELKKLVARSGGRELATETAAQIGLQELPSSERFDQIMRALKQSPRHRKSPPRQATNVWRAPDDSVSAQFSPSGRSFNVALTAVSAREFGQYLVSNLDRLFEAFQATRSDQHKGEQTQKKKAP